MIEAGLQKYADDQEADLRRWAGRLQDAADLAEALVELVDEYMSDRRRAQIEFELCVAAGRNEALQPLGRDWLQGLHEVLAPHVGDQPAHDISAFLDGTMLHMLTANRPLNAPALRSAIRRLAS